MELYSNIDKGSQIFWGELEDYLLINSSEFKNLRDRQLLSRVILAYHKVGRTNETFWKVFSQLYEEFQSEYSFDEKLILLDCFAEHMPQMSLNLYKDFEERYLPKDTAKSLKLPEAYEDRLLLLNII